MGHIPLSSPKELMTDRYASYEQFREVFCEHVAPGKLEFFEALGISIVMGDREGIKFKDRFTGKDYINCHVNGGTYNLGHRNPQVIAAVTEALGSTDIGNHHFGSPHRAEAARRLAQTTGNQLSRVVFAVGGGEAADLALKAVRMKTGRQKVVSALGGYHGHTGLALATGDAKFRDPFGPNLPGFSQVPFDDLGAMDGAIDDDTAAVILETLPATNGMAIPSDGYLAGIRKLCDDRGACLILDEVQSGLGRSGTLWAYEQDDIVPDVVVTAKGLSGGIYPIAATLMKKEVHDPLNNDPFIHISTYGGSEVGCRAALAVLDIVEEPGFLERVRELSDRFARELEPFPFGLRRRGLFMGLEFDDVGPAMGGLIRLAEAGVFCFPSGNDRKVLQFLPPLVIDDAGVDELLSRMKKALLS